MDDTSTIQVIQQISPIEIIAKASPYKELRSCAKKLLAHIENLRTFIENEAFMILAWREFQQAYDYTYRSDMAKFRVDETSLGAMPYFEPRDRGVFSDCLYSIERELELIEEPIRNLKKPDPTKVKIISISLVKITKNTREIITKTNQRLETMAFPINRVIRES